MHLMHYGIKRNHTSGGGDKERRRVVNLNSGGHPGDRGGARREKEFLKSSLEVRRISGS